MAQPYPLPRETRNTDILEGDGRAPATYGPFAFKIFDTADVTVLASIDGAAWHSVDDVAVGKTTGDALSFFTVTFATTIDATWRFVVYGRRLQARETDVTHAGTIRTNELEKELSKQSVTLQEMRRDLDRAFSLVPGEDADSALIEPGEDDSALIWKDSKLVPGPKTDEIGNAQGYATEAKAARDVTTAARDVTIAARDVTTAARDVTVAAAGAADQSRQDAEAARDVTTAARDATIAARDVTTAARDETTTARDVTTAARDTAVGASQDAQDAAQEAADYVNNLPALGTAAEADAEDFAPASIVPTVETALQPGAYGLGASVSEIAPDLDVLNETSFVRAFNSNGAPDSANWAVQHWPMADDTAVQWAMRNSAAGVIRFRYKNATLGWQSWVDVSGAGKATIAYVDAAVSGIGKTLDPVAVMVTTNVTKSGVQNFDGVTGSAGMAYLQNVPGGHASNGIWVMQAGAHVRRADSDTWDEVRSKRVRVNGGTYAGYIFSNNNDAGGTLNTTPITYAESGRDTVLEGRNGVAVSGNFVEIATGTLNVISGAAQKTSNLADLDDKPAAQRNLLLSYPTLAYGATGAGGPTDKAAETAYLDDQAVALPLLQRAVKGSILMSEWIPGSDTEPFMDYANLIFRHFGLEAALRGVRFIFDSAREYYGGTARSAVYTQGDSSGYFIPPKHATIEWQKPWLLHDWPLASSPNIIHRTATMSAGIAVTGPGGDHVRPGHRTLEVDEGHGYVRGERVRIIATAGHSGGGSFTNGVEESGWSAAKAEDHVIHSVTATTVTFFNPVQFFYHTAVAAPKLQKYIDEPMLTLENPWMIGPGRPVGASGGGDRAINVVGGRDFRSYGGRIEDFGGAFFRLGSIMGGFVKGNFARGTLDSVDLAQAIGRGHFYGGAMTDFTWEDNIVEGGGQQFMHSGLGGASEAAAALGISRGVKHRGNSCRGAGAGAMTQHLTGIGFEYVDNDIEGNDKTSWGYDVRQPDTVIRGGKIRNLPNGGAAAFRSNCGGFKMTGVDIDNVQSGPRLTAFNGDDSFVTPPGDIEISNNRMRNVGGAGSAGAISVCYTIRDGGSYADLGKLKITDNEVDCTATTIAIQVEGRWQRPEVRRNRIGDGGTGRSIRVNGGSVGIAAGPRSPIVTDNTQGTARNLPQVAHASGTVTNERNLAV